MTSSRNCAVGRVAGQPTKFEDDVFGGQPDSIGIGAKMGTSEQATGPSVDVAALERYQQGLWNLRGVCDRPQGDPVALPLIPQPLAELALGSAHGRSPACDCRLTAPNVYSTNRVGDADTNVLQHAAGLLGERLTATIASANHIRS